MRTQNTQTVIKKYIIKNFINIKYINNKQHYNHRYCFLPGAKREFKYFALSITELTWSLVK